MNQTDNVISTYNKVAKIYSDKYFDDSSDFPFIDTLLSSLPRDARILDVGCGPGPFVKYIQEKGYQIEGIDFSDEMLKEAKKRVPNGKFQKMNMKNLEYLDNSFDLLLVLYSLIHIPSDEVLETLKGFYKKLKKNGRLAIIVQKGNPDFTAVETFLPSETMFYNFFTVAKLKELLKQAQFILQSMEEQYTEAGEGLTDTLIYAVAKKL